MSRVSASSNIFFYHHRTKYITFILALGFVKIRNFILRHSIWCKSSLIVEENIFRQRCYIDDTYDLRALHPKGSHFRIFFFNIEWPAFCDRTFDLLMVYVLASSKANPRASLRSGEGIKRPPRVNTITYSPSALAVYFENSSPSQHPAQIFLD